MKKFCSHCGNAVDDEAKYCDKCGQPLHRDEDGCAVSEADGLSSDAAQSAGSPKDIRGVWARLQGTKAYMGLLVPVIALMLAIGSFFAGFLPKGADDIYVGIRKSLGMIPAQGYSAIGKKVLFPDGSVKTVYSGASPKEHILYTFTDGEKLYQLTNDFYKMSKIFPETYKEMRAVKPNCFDISQLTTAHEMFRDCGKLENIEELAHWDVSKIRDMGGMFRECNHLTNILSLSGWNVSNVDNMEHMFRQAAAGSALEDIGSLAHWDVSNVENMESMFRGCKIRDLNALAHWNVSNLKNMKGMFSDCFEIVDIASLASWDVSNVTNMKSMFAGCYSLADISSLASWNVSNVTNMGRMFSMCYKLQDISSLGGWDVTRVNNVDGMFEDCPLEVSLNASTPVLGKWKLPKARDYTFIFVDEEDIKYVSWKEVYKKRNKLFGHR